MSDTHPIRFLRLPDVERQTGLSRSTLYAQIQVGQWPRAVRIGPRAVGWPAHEVARINEARLAGEPDVKIAALVSNLLEERRTAAQAP